jgi:hypothetical protein
VIAEFGAWCFFVVKSYENVSYEEFLTQQEGRQNEDSSLPNDYGREVRGEHMGPIEKRHTGNTEKEQFRFEFRGVVSERVHHGSP